MLNDVEIWQQYGLIGLVIGALFCFLFFGAYTFTTLFEKMIKHHKESMLDYQEKERQWRVKDQERHTGEIERIVDKHSEDLRLINSQHKEERAQWSLEANKRDQRYEASMKEFSQAIRELKR